MTDKELDKMWRKAKEGEAKDIEEWNALPEEEKKRRTVLLNSGFGQRLTEDITGGHDDD